MNAPRDERDEEHQEHAAPISILLDIKESLGILHTQHASVIAEQEEARVSRRLMHAKQDETNLALAAIKQDVNAVQGEVKEITPTVVEHERWRQRINGGVAVLVGLGSFVLVAAGFVLKEFWTWFTSHINWR